jgi:hypothetical protein
MLEWVRWVRGLQHYATATSRSGPARFLYNRHACCVAGNNQDGNKAEHFFHSKSPNSLVNLPEWTQAYTLHPKFRARIFGRKEVFEFQSLIKAKYAYKSDPFSQIRQNCPSRLTGAAFQ